MKKIVRRILIFFALIIGMYFLVSTLIDSTIPDEIIGRWEGGGSVYAYPDFELDELSGLYSDEFVFITMNIGQDDSVSGTIGDAIFENGIIKRNRNKLGKLVNINSDYIIVGGVIKGKIYGNDGLELRTVSIPINFEKNLLHGSINLKEPFKYPDPLFSRIKIKHIMD